VPGPCRPVLHRVTTAAIIGTAERKWSGKDRSLTLSLASERLSAVTLSLYRRGAVTTITRAFELPPRLNCGKPNQ